MNDDKLVGIRAAAERLGLCEKSVYRMEDRGLLERVDLGIRRVMFRESDIQDLVAGRLWQHFGNKKASKPVQTGPNGTEPNLI